LTDLGADVVKIQWPRGDVTNVFGVRRAGISGLFTQMNAGKRGVSLDLSNPRGAALVKQLASRAQIVIENFRPGVLDRAGLGYEELSRDNQHLVMLSVSGFGRTGPESHRKAYAPVIHAESGMLARQATFDDRYPTDIAMSLADTIAALHGTIAVLAALRHSERTGEGQHIDLGMLQAMVASDDYAHDAIDGTTDLYPARGTIWDATGGPVMVAADTKALWIRFAQHTDALDPTEASDDEPTKISKRGAVFGAWVKSFDDRSELTKQLDAANLPWATVRTNETLLASPTLQADDVVALVDDHMGGTRGVIKMPYRFSSVEASVRGPAPSTGQHNTEVLVDWLGMNPQELEQLEIDGVLLRQRQVNA
jgi:CoA:oxalate CoA-transferase